MDRTLFITITTIILLSAFLLGWFAHWVITRVARLRGSNMDEVDKLAQMLHDAEEMRDQAIVYIEQREQELMGQTHQVEAELRAVTEGLREARYENEEMRKYIQKHIKAGGG